MKLKFPETLLAFSMLFLFSCGQDEAVNKNMIVTKKGDPHKVKWATKTHPDGTIMRMHELKELSDGRTVQSKPEGWEWDDRPVTRPSYIEEFQQVPNLEDGVNIFKKKDGTEEEFVVVIEKEFEKFKKLADTNYDWSELDFVRCLAYRDIRDYLFHDATAISTIKVSPTLENTISEISGSIYNTRHKGNSIEVNVVSKTSSVGLSLDAFDLSEEADKLSKEYANFEDRVDLFIKINDDSLKISCEMEEPSKNSGKEYMWWNKYTTTLKGNNYASSSDFFKKLSELGLVKERILAEGLISVEFSDLYFMFFVPKNSGS